MISRCRMAGRPGAAGQRRAPADHQRERDRTDAYLDCGMETVNGSDVLLAVWDGEAARGRGGTAEVIEYAQSMGKPIIIIDATTDERRRENWEALERDEPELTSLNRLPEREHLGRESLQGAGRGVRLPAEMRFHATNSAPQLRRMTVSTVLVHVLATMIGAAVVAYGLHLLRLAVDQAVVHHLRASCAALVLRRTHAFGTQLGEVPARGGVLPLGTGHLGIAARRPPAAGPGPAGASTTWRARCTSCTRRSSATRPCRSRNSSACIASSASTTSSSITDARSNRALPLLQAPAPGVLAGHGSRWRCTAFYAIARHAAHLDVPEWLQETMFEFLPIFLPRGRRGHHLGHFDQRPAAPCGALPRHAGDARGQPRADFLLQDLEQPGARGAAHRARAAAGSHRVAFDLAASASRTSATR